MSLRETSMYPLLPAEYPATATAETSVARTRCEFSVRRDG